MSTVPASFKRARSGSSCPLCGNAPVSVHRPFCSQGCRDRDLLNWLGDAYRVPGQATDPHGHDRASAGLDSDA